MLLLEVDVGETIKLEVDLVKLNYFRKGVCDEACRLPLIVLGCGELDATRHLDGCW